MPPDGDFLTNRRGALALMAGAAGMSIADLSEALGGADGNLWAGISALGQAYNVSGELYIGPNSARSSVTANSGRVYLASDTEEIWYGDAGNWTQMGLDVPSLTTQQLLGDWDHLVATSDDLNSVIANDVSAGDVVQITNGIHTVTKSGLNALEITPDNVTLRGMGQGVTTIKLEDNASTDAGTPSDEAIIAIGTSGGASPTGVVIERLTIDGNKANQTTASNELIHGISPRGAGDYSIRDVEIKNCTNGGVWNGTTDSGVGGEITRPYIHDCDRDGIFLSTNDVDIFGGTIEDITLQDGVELAGDNQRMVGTRIRNTAGAGVEIYRATNVTVSDTTVIVGSNGPDIGFSFLGTSGDQTTGSTFSDCLFVGSGNASNADHPIECNEFVSGCEYRGIKSVQQAAVIPIDTAGADYHGLHIVDSAAGGVTVSEGTSAISGVTVVNPTDRGLRINGGADGLVVRDLTVEGSGGEGALLLSDDITLDGYAIKSAANKGVNASGATGLSLSDGVVKNCGDVGVQIINSDAIAVRGLELSGNTNGEIRIQESDGSAHSEFALSDIRQLSGSIDLVQINTSTGSVEDVTINNHRLASGVLDVSNGTRVAIDGVIQEALGGGAPGTPANYDDGVIVEDADNAGDAYLKLPSSGFSQIST